MKVCPECHAEFASADPAALCPLCLLVGAVGPEFRFSETKESHLNTKAHEQTERDSFGPYSILSVLGEGGMGTVYLAEQNGPIHRRVALKVVKLGMDTNQVLARFNHERQTLARMEHSGIAGILDAGSSSRGRPFFVMDYIEGACITTYCDQNYLTVAQRLELFLPVCNAVQHAHDRGIIHRDIKPSNILIATEDNKPVSKVIDFGIARAIHVSDPGETMATQFGQMVGTPEYASPEQADLVAGEISAATDVYSLGVLLYELLAGAVPFSAELLRKVGFSEMLRIIREENAPSLVQRLDSLGPTIAHVAAMRDTDAAGLRKSLASHLDQIVNKALQKEPHQRYCSAAELGADIERYLKGEPVLAAPSRFRKPLVMAAAGLLLITTVWLVHHALTFQVAESIPSTIILSDITNDTGDPFFDRMFRQTVSVPLQGSSKLRLLSESRIAESLRDMRRTAGTRVNPEMAREICQRTGSAAFLESSISKAGSGYFLALRASNCLTGDLLDEEQARAAGKEEALNRLSDLSGKLQSKMHVAFATSQKDAVPLEVATTSSLEALRSFTAARRRMWESPADALLLFRRAIELDPEFALAYAHLGRNYADAGEQTLAMENIHRAYLLRGPVSDPENFFITYNYNRDVLRNLELCRQVCDSWIEKYPREMLPHGFLSGLTSVGTAQYQKSVEEGEKSVALDPDFPIGYQNIAAAYLALGRVDQVTAVLRRAAQRKLPQTSNFPLEFFVAFLNRDKGAMDRIRAQVAVASPNGLSEHMESMVAAREGRVQQSRQASTQAVAMALQAHLHERAALFQGAAAIREALYGNGEESFRLALAVNQLSKGRDADFAPAFARALSGDPAATLATIRSMEKQYPEDTCVHFIYAPVLRALLAIHEGAPARAIEYLAVSTPYDFAQTGLSSSAHYGVLYTSYVRGLAYRQLHKHREAAGEFQTMLDHPGLLLADPIGAAARVQLARALRDSGQTGKAAAVYSEFLTLWKDADAGVPLLKQVKAESARL